MTRFFSVSTIKKSREDSAESSGSNTSSFGDVYRESERCAPFIQAAAEEARRAEEDVRITHAYAAGAASMTKTCLREEAAVTYSEVHGFKVAPSDLESTSSGGYNLPYKTNSNSQNEESEAESQNLPRSESPQNESIPKDEPVLESVPVENEPESLSESVEDKQDKDEGQKRGRSDSDSEDAKNKRQKTDNTTDENNNAYDNNKSEKTENITDNNNDTDDNNNKSEKTEKKESLIDYVLAKQQCEMPDIFDSDGGD